MEKTYDADIALALYLEKNLQTHVLPVISIAMNVVRHFSLENPALRPVFIFLASSPRTTRDFHLPLHLFLSHITALVACATTYSRKSLLLIQ